MQILRAGVVYFALVFAAGFGASRDPVSGTVYAVMLSVFTIMPPLVARSVGREAPVSS